MTTTLNPHLPPETFAQDVIAVLGEHLAPLVDGHGTVAAIHFLGLAVNGRPLHEWLAIGFAAVDARTAELATSHAALREFPRQAEATREARDWHADGALCSEAADEIESLRLDVASLEGRLDRVQAPVGELVLGVSPGYMPQAIIDALRQWATNCEATDRCPDEAGTLRVAAAEIEALRAALIEFYRFVQMELEREPYEHSLSSYITAGSPAHQVAAALDEEADNA